MKSILLVLVSSVSLSAFAGVRGDLGLNLGFDKKCVRASDTLWGGVGFSLTDSVVSVDADERLGLGVTFQSVRCVIRADGTFGFINVDPRASYSYDVGRGDHVQHIVMFRRETELVLLNPSVAILDVASVGGGEAAQTVHFSAALKDVLGAKGWQRFNAGEKVEFVMDLGFRSIESYTVNGSAETSLGQKSSFAFRFSGEAVRRDGRISLDLRTPEGPRATGPLR